jgi:drug/metabolite transporter (DMT)-like permease
MRFIRADILLLLAAAIWGAGFVAQRSAADHLSPAAFNAIRFGLGLLILLPLAVRSMREMDPPARSALKAGSLFAGGILFLGANLQQWGMESTTAGNGGFITGLYVIFVPILGLFLKHRVSASIWIACVLAVIGMALLTLGSSDAAAWSINTGDALVLAGAAVWACHVLSIGWFVQKTRPIPLAAGQLLVAGVLSTIWAVAFAPPTMEAIAQATWPLLYSGIMAVGVAFTLQVIAQRSAPPAHTAILLSFEAVFAVLAGWLLLHELLTPWQLAGCGLMLAGMFLASLRPGARRLP